MPLLLALALCAAYCLGVELVMVLAGPWLGRLFVDDIAVITALARMMKLTVLLLVVTGPTLLVGFYFQAIGTPGRSAVLTLGKPFLFHPVLIFVMGPLWGADGIWLSSPMGDVIVLGIALVIWLRNARPYPGFGLPAQSRGPLSDRPLTLYRVSCIQKPRNRWG